MSHSRRRAEGIPLHEAKLKTNLARRFPHKQQGVILAVSMDQAKFEAMPVNEYVDPYT